MTESKEFTRLRKEITLLSMLSRHPLSKYRLNKTVCVNNPRLSISKLSNKQLNNLIMETGE